MKSELHIDDWIEGEDDATAAELFEALGELRPDPDDFATGVAERIAAAGEEPAVDDVAFTEPHPGLRWAAGVLPPILLPKGISKLALGSGGAAASKAGVKLVPGLAALPIVTVLMLGVTLLVALRSALGPKPTAEQATDPREAATEVALWWRRNLLPVLAVLALVVLLWFRAPKDAVVLLLLGSTLVLVGIVGRLAAAGFATRRELGRRLGGTLFLGATFVVQLRGLLPETTGGPLGTDWVLPLLAAGSALCLALAHFGARGHRAVLLVTLGGWVGLMGIFGTLAYATAEVLRGPEDLLAWVGEGEDEQLRDPGRWGSITSGLVQLRDAGYATGDLGPFRDAVRAGLDEAGASLNSLYLADLLLADLGLERLEDLEAHPPTRPVEDLIAKGSLRVSRHEALAILGALRAGTFDERVTTWVEGLRPDHEAAVVRGERGPYGHGIEGFRSLRGLDPAWLELLAAGPEAPVRPEAVAREVLVRRVLASRPAGDNFDRLEGLEVAARVLEALGADERVDELAPRAHASLASTWTPTADGRQGAFPGWPALQDRDEGGFVPAERLTFVWIDDTALAVGALARWGLSGEAGEGGPIDLLALERYLEVQSRVHRFAGLGSYEAQAIGALALLRSLPEHRAAVEAAAAARGPLDALVQHRLLLAALLLTAFAVFATWRAPEVATELEPEELTVGLLARRAFLDSRAR